jgi:hypothetical protein
LQEALHLVDELQRKRPNAQEQDDDGDDVKQPFQKKTKRNCDDIDDGDDSDDVDEQPFQNKTKKDDNDIEVSSPQWIEEMRLLISLLEQAVDDQFKIAPWRGLRSTWIDRLMAAKNLDEFKDGLWELTGVIQAKDGLKLRSSPLDVDVIELLEALEGAIQWQLCDPQSRWDRIEFSVRLEELKEIIEEGQWK